MDLEKDLMKYSIDEFKALAKEYLTTLNNDEEFENWETYYDLVKGALFTDSGGFFGWLSTREMSSPTTMDNVYFCQWCGEMATVETPR